MLKKENIFSFIWEGLLMAFIVCACLLGGTESVYRSYLVQLFAVILLGAMFCQLLFKPGTAFCYPPAVYFMLGFFIIIFFQCIPLPIEIIKILSSKTANLYQHFLPPEDQRHWHTLSVYSFATQKKLVELGASLSIFLVVLNVIKTKNQVRRLITLCVALTVFASLYAAIKGGFTSGYSSATFGLFSNRNYYAGLALLMSHLCIGCALSFQNTAKKIFFLFLAGMLLVSIVLSLSRAAILSGFLWLGIMTVWFIQRKLFTRKVTLTFILFIAILIALFIIVNLGPLTEKVENMNRSLTLRSIAYHDALSIIRDFPLWGVGLGNYVYVVPQYSSRSLETFDSYIHSDVLQLVVEGGVLGGIFYGLFFIFLFKDIIVQLYRRHDFFVKCVLIGGVSSICALITHSLFEVLLPIPAVGFLLWFIAALVYKTAYIQADTAKE